MNYLYYAVPITEESGFDLDKRVKMSWLAIGLYVFLRKSPLVTIEQIASEAYDIPQTAIVLALKELLDQGLIGRQATQEVTA